MTTISEDIVETTWREVASLEPDDARRAMERVTRRQPSLLAFVMAETQDCGRDAQELAVYLFFVVLRMFEKLPGHSVRRVSVGQLERRARENEALFERFLDADERFLERAAVAEAASQPHVFEYLTEAMLEEGDPELELTEQESGLVFLVLKTIVDVLDQACQERRRSGA